MKVGIVVCSSADLPQQFIQENDVNIMPISLLMKGEDFIDTRDPIATKEFYKKYAKNKNLLATTAPYSVEQIKEWFLNELVIKYDRVLVLTIAKNRSDIFNNATQASFEILKGYRQKRREAGVKGSFSLRVYDTENFFTGEAVVAYEAVRLNKERDIPFDKWRKHLDEVAKHTHGFLVPDDLYYLKNVASRRGEKNIGGLKYLLAKTFDVKPILHGHLGDSSVFDKGKGYDDAMRKVFEHAKSEFVNGLRVPVVCMSFAGDLSEIEEREDYQEFIKTAKEFQIKPMLTVMSTTAGINLGPRGFTLAYSKL